MGRALSAHKIWGRSYAWYRLWVDLAQIRALFVGVDRCEMAVRSLLFSGRLDLDEILWQLDLDDTRVM